jgi:hypothetical protein
MNEVEVSKQSLGGTARANSLTADQRREIAKIAAKSRWDQSIPKPTYTGSLTILDRKIPCAVYEDKGGVVHRYIVQREVVGLITGNKKGGLDRYLAARNLQRFVPEKFKEKSLDQAVAILNIDGKQAYCYEGEDIVDILYMYIDARTAERSIKGKAGEKILLPSQEKLADQAEIIVKSLAKVGIAGLIDEATGYQYFREKNALQEYLNKVIRQELAAWVQRFPNEFFEQIARLRGWTIKSKGRYPSVVGKYITDLVYSRLGPGVLDELKRLNPKTESGQRKAKHHQWLTDDVGHPMLAQHLYALITLMRGYDTWDEFYKFATRIYPKSNEKQLSLFL